MQAFTKPLQTVALDGEVVILGEGSMCGSMLPEAVLASLDDLRAAAELAIVQRALHTTESFEERTMA